MSVASCSGEIRYGGTALYHFILVCRPVGASVIVGMSLSRVSSVMA